MRLSPKIIFVMLTLTLLGLSQPKGPSSRARYRNHGTKILCWIPTDPIYHENRSLHVKNTWGKRCDKLVFFTTEYDDMLPSIVVNSPPGWEYLWGKVRSAIQVLYKRYLYEADWFLKADDDTYVIIENLKHLLKDYDPSEELVFGSIVTGMHKNYMYGGAGYVLSRAAIKKLVEVAFKDPEQCTTNPKNSEDYELALCLHSIGVTFGNSLDEFGKDRFFPLRLDFHTQPFKVENNSWIWSGAVSFAFPGIPNCSRKPISFHKVTPGFMYVFEYLLYHTTVVIENHTKFY